MKEEERDSSPSRSFRTSSAVVTVCKKASKPCASSATDKEDEECSASAADALMSSHGSPGLAVLTVIVASVITNGARDVCTGLSSESFPPRLLDLRTDGAKLRAAAGAASALGACLCRPDCCRAETAADAEEEDSSPRRSVKPPSA